MTAEARIAQMEAENPALREQVSELPALREQVAMLLTHVVRLQRGARFVLRGRYRRHV